MDQVNTTTATTTTTIGALGEELLLFVFHALSWRDRVRGVEGVCRHWHQLMRTHGWDDVRHFDEYRAKVLQLWGHPSGNDHRYNRWMDPFLSRISLDIFYDYPEAPSIEAVAESEDCWGWLEGMRHLEYLVLSKTPPLATICAIIKGCKWLRQFTPGHDYSPTAEEKAALSATVDQMADAVLLPHLSIKVKDDTITDKSSRVRFFTEEISPVAHRYAFCCLSEGEPQVGW